MTQGERSVCEASMAVPPYSSSSGRRVSTDNGRPARHSSQSTVARARSKRSVGITSSLDHKSTVAPSITIPGRCVAAEIFHCAASRADRKRSGWRCRFFPLGPDDTSRPRSRTVAESAVHFQIQFIKGLHSGVPALGLLGCWHGHAVVGSGRVMGAAPKLELIGMLLPTVIGFEDGLVKLIQGLIPAYFDYPADLLAAKLRADRATDEEDRQHIQVRWRRR